MKPFRFVALALSFHLASLAQQPKQAQPRALTVQQFDGGSMVTKIGSSGAINEGSALKRIFFIVNDPTCAVQLLETGIESRYLSGGNFVFRKVGSATARESISAVEISLMLFDLWGSHIRDLAVLKVTEISKGAEVPRDSEWATDGLEVTQFMTSVSYVKQVRTSDGKIWRADTRAILEKLASMQLRISAEDLESLASGPSSKGK